MNHNIIDSHTHLYFDQFSDDLEAVLDRSKAAGITRLLIPGVDLESSARAVELASTIEGAFCAIGIHPHYAQRSLPFDRKRADSLAENPKVVAAGEIGLDYYRNISPPDIQRKLFRSCLDWAKDRGLPVIVHMREAFDDVYNILKEYPRNEKAGVMHCFSGTVEQARKFIDLGYMISFAGQITYPKSHGLREVVKHVPLEKLLVETDAPYLTPQPERPRRNEPAFIIHTIAKIAEIKQIEPAAVARATSANGTKLFGFSEK